MLKHCVYRYVYKGQTIYIGKCDRELCYRLKEHSKECKFQPYVGKCKIEYIETSSNIESKTLESCLIAISGFQRTVLRSKTDAMRNITDAPKRIGVRWAPQNAM